MISCPRPKSCPSHDSRTQPQAPRARCILLAHLRALLPEACCGDSSSAGCSRTAPHSSFSPPPAPGRGCRGRALGALVMPWGSLLLGLCSLAAGGGRGEVALLVGVGGEGCRNAGEGSRIQKEMVKCLLSLLPGWQASAVLRCVYCNDFQPCTGHQSCTASSHLAYVTKMSVTPSSSTGWVPESGLLCDG